MNDQATAYQLGWYLKRTPGPGRRAIVGTEVFNAIAEAFDKAGDLLSEGFEVRILPIQRKA